MTKTMKAEEQIFWEQENRIIEKEQNIPDEMKLDENVVIATEKIEDVIDELLYNDNDIK